MNLNRSIEINKNSELKKPQSIYSGSINNSPFPTMNSKEKQSPQITNFHKKDSPFQNGNDNNPGKSFLPTLDDILNYNDENRNSDLLIKGKNEEIPTLSIVKSQSEISEYSYKFHSMSKNMTK